jgi:hypothetical protein
MKWRDVDGPFVTVGRPTEGQLTFLKPVRNGPHDVRLPIRIEAVGLSANSNAELAGWGGGVPGLIAYFAEITEAWRGWTGPKEWRDDEGMLHVSATHDGVGTISLRLTATPLAGWDGPGSWRVTATIAMEAGSLDATLVALRELLG